MINSVFIDLYEGNPVTNASLVASNVDGVYLRLTDLNAKRVDNLFDKNYALFKGLTKRGVYVVPDLKLTKEDNFIKIKSFYMNHVTSGTELPLMYDVETYNEKTEAQLIEEIDYFVNEWYNYKKEYPLIYSANWWIRQNIPTLCPKSAKYCDFIIAYYPYDGERKYFNSWKEGLTWMKQYVGQTWVTNSLTNQYPLLWQAFADNDIFPGVQGDVDVIFSRLTAEDTVRELYNTGGTGNHYYMPIDEGYRISQLFGEHPEDYAQYNLAGHDGIDWATPVGCKVYASQNGTVTRAEAVSYGYGRHIRIKSETGTTIYGHLSKMLVKVGDTVKAKQLIGYTGGNLEDPYRGNSSGAHIHFEIRPDVGGLIEYGGAVDPLPLIVRQDYDNTGDNMVLFKIQTLVNLYVRTSPEIKNSPSNISRLLSIGSVVEIIKEANGWGQLNSVKTEWIAISNSNYVRKIEVTPTPTPVTDDIEKRIEALETDVKLIKEKLSIG